MNGAKQCHTCRRIRVSCSYDTPRGRSRNCKPCRDKAELPPKICTRCDALCKGSDFVSDGVERKWCSLCRQKAREDAARRAKG